MPHKVDSLLTITNSSSHNSNYNSNNIRLLLWETQMPHLDTPFNNNKIPTKPR